MIIDHNFTASPNIFDTIIDLVIQRRSQYSSYDSCDSPPCQDNFFDKGWSEYRQGFGSLSGDYWMGLDELYNLTNTEGRTWSLEVIINIVYNICKAWACAEIASALGHAKAAPNEVRFCSTCYWLCVISGAFASAAYGRFSLEEFCP